MCSYYGKGGNQKEKETGYGIFVKQKDWRNRGKESLGHKELGQKNDVRAGTTVSGKGGPLFEKSECRPRIRRCSLQASGENKSKTTLPQGGGQGEGGGTGKPGTVPTRDRHKRRGKSTIIRKSPQKGKHNVLGRRPSHRKQERQRDESALKNGCADK